MSAAGTSAAVEYDAFAPYYDAFTERSDYAAWAREVLRLARRLGLRGERMLDLACGTGSSFMPFLERGFDVTGCDVSGAMLARAAERAPSARLVQADIARLPELGPFDLVTCFDDSLNYLAGRRELAGAFAGIERSLDAGGLAAFDLNTLLAYRTTFACHDVSEVGDVLFAWRGEASAAAPPGCAVEARLDIFAGGERISTRHRQRHFPRDQVLALLAGAGLECIGVHGVEPDCSLVGPADESRHLKVLYTARRMRGGDAR